MYSGRIDRMGFFVGSAFLLGPVLFTLAAFFFLYYMFGGGSAFQNVTFLSLMNFVLVIIGFIWAIVLLPLYFGLMIRRFHDLDLSGWFSLLHLIPFVNVVICLLLIFYPGTRGPNRFGETKSPRSPQDALFVNAFPPVASGVTLLRHFLTLRSSIKFEWKINYGKHR